MIIIFNTYQHMNHICTTLCVIVENPNIFHTTGKHVVVAVSFNPAYCTSRWDQMATHLRTLQASFCAHWAHFIPLNTFSATWITAKLVAGSQSLQDARQKLRFVPFFVSVSWFCVTQLNTHIPLLLHQCVTHLRVLSLK